ncbi:MAG TPA: hypothetical protein VF649_09880 [Sphingomonas sp.]
MMILSAVLTAFLMTGPVHADENRVLKCKIGKARSGGRYDGPALVANVPRAMTPIDLNAVQMTDKAVTKAVIVESMLAERTPTDTLRVMTRLVNCTKAPLQVEARSNFLDANQAPAEVASVWKRVFIPPLATAVYTESSISRLQVQQYLVELRSAQ